MMVVYKDVSNPQIIINGWVVEARVFKLETYNHQTIINGRDYFKIKINSIIHIYFIVIYFAL